MSPSRLPYLPKKAKPSRFHASGIAKSEGLYLTPSSVKQYIHPGKKQLQRGGVGNEPNKIAVRRYTLKEAVSLRSNHANTRRHSQGLEQKKLQTSAGR
jgi:hypothetical protein